MKKGSKHTKESLNKIRLARAKQVPPWLGKKRPPFSEKYRENMRKIALKKGYGKWMLGKKLPLEVIKKITMSAKRGKENPAWKGGISFNPYPPEWTMTLRLAIRQRDNFTCQRCGITEEEHLKKLKRILSVNHIDFNKNNCDPKNLNTLCVACNSFINNDREYWMRFFLKKQGSVEAFGLLPLIHKKEEK